MRLVWPKSSLPPVCLEGSRRCLLGDDPFLLLPPLEGSPCSVARLVALLLGFIVAHNTLQVSLREWIGAVYVLTMFVFLEPCSHW